MTDIEVVSFAKHKVVFNVKNLPPKTAVTLRSAMEFQAGFVSIHRDDLYSHSMSLFMKGSDFEN
jgi:hypothetical protein